MIAESLNASKGLTVSTWLERSAISPPSLHLNMEQALGGRSPTACLHRRVPHNAQQADLTVKQRPSHRQRCRTECPASRRQPSAWQEAGVAALGAGLGATLVDAAVRASPAAAADLVTQVIRQLYLANACQMNVKKSIHRMASLRIVSSCPHIMHATHACMRAELSWDL